MSHVIHETATTISTAVVGADYAGERFVEVEYLPRKCSSVYVSRIYADGTERIRNRINSQRSKLPTVIRNAALKLLGA